MKVLVTGGAGYIGSVSVDALIAAGHEVVVLDNLYMGHRSAVNPSAIFVEADLCDAPRVNEIMDQHKPNAIMHFASYSLVGESMQDPAKYLGANTTNALNLIDAGVKNGVERFILSSTANLFGSPETIPISENEKLDPGSPYGESKFFIERLLRWYSETHGLKYAALRYFNAAGCTPTKGEDHDPESHLIPLVLQVALGQRSDIKIFGDDYNTPDGTCIRDYIHVSDLADAHVLALEALSEKDVLEFNLGNGNGFSVKEVIETVRKVTGHAIPAEIIARRAGDPDALVADSTKIKTELGWEPRFPNMDDVVSSAWEWHSKNPNGYKDYRTVSDLFVTLPDGRRLAYAEFGADDGVPVIYFHGWPACRMEATLYAEAASSAGVRLISPDRPGFGLSDFAKNRSLLSFSTDIVALADELQLDKFHILGHSGGGPYAAAFAHQFTDRLLGASVVAGLSPMNDARTREGMRKMNQFLLTVGSRFPWVLSMMMKGMRNMTKSPEQLAKSMTDLPDVDKDLMATQLPELVELIKESFRQGTTAATQDGQILGSPWGFPLSEISIPMTIWQGSLDVNVPLSNGRLYAEEIPNAVLNLIEGEGHFSMAANHGTEIFRDLLSA